MIYPKLNLKIAKLVEVRELIILVELIKVKGLVANKNRHLNKITKARRVGKAS